MHKNRLSSDSRSKKCNSSSLEILYTDSRDPTFDDVKFSRSKSSDWEQGEFSFSPRPFFKIPLTTLGKFD